MILKQLFYFSEKWRIIKNKKFTKKNTAKSLFILKILFLSRVSK